MIKAIDKAFGYALVVFGFIAFMLFGSAADSLELSTLIKGLVLAGVAFAGGAALQWISNK